MGPVATGAAQKQPAPGVWPGRTDGAGLGVPAAAVLPLLVGAGLAHLNGHNQASSEDSREGVLPLRVTARSGRRVPRDCAQALPGMIREAADGTVASGSPVTTAGQAASLPTPKVSTYAECRAKPGCAGL